MKSLFPLLVLNCVLLSAQAPAPSQASQPSRTAPAVVNPPAPGPGVNFLSLPPDTLIAIVDGNKVTAADVQGILRGMPPQAQRQAMMNANAFLNQLGLLRRLTGMAVETKLEQKSPIREQLEYGRMVTLAQAMLSEKQNQITIAPEEIQKFYDANPGRFSQAKVKAIYIAFSANPAAKPDSAGKTPLSEAEALEKARKVLADIRAGADFVKMVKEHSQDPVSAAKDGDYGTIRGSDRLPDAIKTAVLSLKPGEVSEPVRQPSGFYLFRLEELGAQPLDEVRVQIMNELRNARFSEWLQTTQKTIEIKIEYQPLLQPPQPVPMPPTAPAPAPVKP
jgi:peptidyl-prolyl cis-trans isomerase C